MLTRLARRSWTIRSRYPDQCPPLHPTRVGTFIRSPNGQRRFTVSLKYDTRIHAAARQEFTDSGRSTPPEGAQSSQQHTRYEFTPSVCPLLCSELLLGHCNSPVWIAAGLLRGLDVTLSLPRSKNWRRVLGKCRLGLVGLFAVLIALANVELAAGHGAVAVRDSNGSSCVGPISLNMDSEDEAEKSALSGCDSSGQRCTIARTFENQCVATAGCAWAIADDIDTAASIADAKCRAQGGSDCSTVFRKCDRSSTRSSTRKTTGAFVALALDADTTFWGTGRSNESRDAAEKLALDFCRKTGARNCSVRISVQGGCIAYATGPGSSWYASRDTREVAIRDAVANCSKRGVSCKLQGVVCSQD